MLYRNHYECVRADEYLVVVSGRKLGRGADCRPGQGLALREVVFSVCKADGRNVDCWITRGCATCHGAGEHHGEHERDEPRTADIPARLCPPPDNQPQMDTDGHG